MRNVRMAGPRMPVASVRFPVSGSTPHQTPVANRSLGFSARVTLLLLGMYIILKPYYLLPSGWPQIADFLVVLEMVFLPFLPEARYDPATRKLIYCMFVFGTYALLVDLGWSIALADRSMAIYGAYYAFNCGLLLICLRVGTVHTQATLRVIAYAVVISAVIQGAMGYLGHNPAQYRQTASFNNPNQLGYWSLLCLCIFLCITLRVKLKWYIQFPAIICLCYSVALSLSKAAMISAALMLALHFARSPRLIAVAMVTALVGYLALENSSLTNNVEGRLENIGSQADDSLYSRGYLRIIDYPQYEVIGAGEGGIYRFNDTAYSDERFEIHSTFATILFSYGIPGAVLFVMGIWQLYRASSIGYLLYLFPPFLYGLTHQGLRFSFLWLLFSVIAASGLSKRQESARPAQPDIGRRPAATARERS